MNKTFFTGRLTTTPVISTSAANIPYLKFALAVKDNNSNEKIVHFVKMVAFKSTANYIVEHAGKGSLMFIEGSFTTNNYKNKNGANVYDYSIVVNSATIINSGVKIKGELENQEESTQEHKVYVNLDDLFEYDESDEENANFKKIIEEANI